MVVALGLSLLAGCASDPKTGPDAEETRRSLDANAFDEPVELTVGEPAVLEVRSNPSTGYRWSWIHEREDGPEIVRVRDQYVSDPNPDQADGVGGHTLLEFTGLRTGEATIRLYCDRGAQEEPVHVVRCVVREATKPR